MSAGERPLRHCTRNARPAALSPRATHGRFRLHRPPGRRAPPDRWPPGPKHAAERRGQKGDRAGELVCWLGSAPELPWSGAGRGGRPTRARSFLRCMCAARADRVGANWHWGDWGGGPLAVAPTAKACPHKEDNLHQANHGSSSAAVRGRRCSWRIEVLTRACPARAAGRRPTPGAQGRPRGAGAAQEGVGQYV